MQYPDANDFIEQVMRDSQGRHVKQSLIHQIWQSHITWCVTNSKYCGIVAPMGHGKTENVTIARPLYFFGLDNNLRQKLICNTDGNATDRVISIKKYIEESKEYHSIFPHVKPSKKLTPLYLKGKKIGNIEAKDGKWQSHSIVLQRDGMSKDASLEAWGVMSKGLGGRADVMIFDDVVDQKNAIDEPGMRKKVIDTYESTWLSRLEPDGVLIYIATVWHEDDLTNYLMKNPSFSFIFMGISSDNTAIDMKLINAGETHPCYTGEETIRVPLWENKFNKTVLDAMEAGRQASTYARCYRNIPYSDKDLTFPSFNKCINKDISTKEWIEHAKEATNKGLKVTFATGVDLSGAKRSGNVIFTVGAIEGENRIVPVDIKIGENWTSPTTASYIKEVYRVFKPVVINIENVALQEMLLEWMRLDADRGYTEAMPIEGFMTGRNKSNPEIGLPGMEVEFKNNMWEIPFKDQADHSSICRCNWCQWKATMNSAPFSSETDTMMASWFAREGIRKYALNGSILTDEDYEEVSKTMHTINSNDVEQLDRAMQEMYEHSDTDHENEYTENIMAGYSW